MNGTSAKGNIHLVEWIFEFLDSCCSYKKEDYVRKVSIWAYQYCQGDLKLVLAKAIEVRKILRL